MSTTETSKKVEKVETTTETTRPRPSGPTPVVIDLGTHGRGSIRKLRKGRGKLLDEVTDVVDQLTTEGTVAKDAQVVIVVVRERPEDMWSAWLDR